MLVGTQFLPRFFFYNPLHIQAFRFFAITPFRNCSDSTGEGSLGPLAVPLFDPNVRADIGEHVLEVLAHAVAFALDLLAPVEVQIALIAILGLVLVRETGIERSGLQLDRRRIGRLSRFRAHLGGVLWWATCLKHRISIDGTMQERERCFTKRGEEDRAGNIRFCIRPIRVQGHSQLDFFHFLLEWVQIWEN